MKTKNVKGIRFLRERCRIYPTGSLEFNALLDSMKEKTSEGKLESQLENLTIKFESEFAQAILLEKVAKIEDMINTLKGLGTELENNIFIRFWLALGYEKTDKLNEAQSLYVDLLSEKLSIQDKLAVEFNLCVCYEKAGLYKKVDFLRFINCTDIKYNGERLIDKCLTMHLIMCIKTDAKFIKENELKQSIDYLFKNDFQGYVKMYLAFFHYKKETKMTGQVLKELFENRNQLTINNKVAMLSTLRTYLDKNECFTLLQIIETELNEIQRKTKSITIDKFINNNPV